VARVGAELVRRADHLELLLEPELSIVLFRRLGWDTATYQAWSDDQLATEQSFVTPTAWHGETVLRWCIVNPLTTVEDLGAIVDSLARFGG
jgi:L-2,4-diaminobutyrate decarboxylase